MDGSEYLSDAEGWRDISPKPVASGFFATFLSKNRPEQVKEALTGRVPSSYIESAVVWSRHGIDVVIIDLGDSDSQSWFDFGLVLLEVRKIAESLVMEGRRREQIIDEAGVHDFYELPTRTRSRTDINECLVMIRGFKRMYPSIEEVEAHRMIPKSDLDKRHRDKARVIGELRHLARLRRTGFQVHAKQ